MVRVCGAGVRCGCAVRLCRGADVRGECVVRLCGAGVQRRCGVELRMRGAGVLCAAQCADVRTCSAVV